MTPCTTILLPSRYCEGLLKVPSLPTLPLRLQARADCGGGQVKAGAKTGCARNPPTTGRFPHCGQLADAIALHLGHRPLQNKLGPTVPGTCQVAL